MAGQQQVTARTARLLVATAEAICGRDCRDLVDGLGFAPDWATSVDAMLPRAAIDRLWARTIERTRVVDLGLRMAATLRHGRHGRLGALGYLLTTAPDLGEAYRRVVRHQNLMQRNASQWALQELGDRWRFELTLTPPTTPTHSQVAEFALATIVGLGRDATRTPWQPVRVGFVHPAMSPPEVYARAFGGPPVFEAPANAVELDVDTTRLPIPAADPELAALVQTFAASRTEDAPASMRQRVAQTLAKKLHEPRSSLASVAKALATSERSLRRRLQEEGVTFQAVLDEVRFAEARRYLADPTLSTEEVALLLGFSEAGSLYRAFRRWAGEGLSEYRRRSQSK